MRRLLCYFLLFFLTLTGCSQEDKEQKEEPKTAPVEELSTVQEPAKRPPVELKLAEFTENAWLRDSLPGNTDVYLRVPTLWYLFTGVENGFKYAQKNEQHVKLLEAIQQGLHNQVTSQLEPAIQPLVSILSTHMKSPLEVGVIPNENTPIAPTVILATKLDFETADDFYKNLSAMLALNEMIQETAPMDADGRGAFAVPALNNTSVYSFNAITKELLVITSNALMIDDLHTIAAEVKPTPSHPMHTIESSIDASSKGVFGYIDVKNLLPKIQSIVPPDVLMGLKMSGFEQAKSLAFGYGTSQDKTRLKIIVDIPNIGFRAYLPSAKNNVDFYARGNIDLLGVMALPTEVQFKQLENLLSFAGQSSPEYTQAKEMFKAQTGLEIEQIFSMIGPEAAVFSDDISDFLAIRLNNPEQFSQLLKTSAEKKWLKYDEFKRETITIRHVSVSLAGNKGVGELQETLQDDPASAPNLSALLNIFGKINSHFYWIEEDGFIILSSIPQPLIERSLRDDRISAKEWLATSQKHDMSSSLIGLSTSKKDISRDFYYHYLQILHFLADISEAQVDFLSLPHAGDLKFHEKGSVSFSFNSHENYLALEFSFEESIVDLFYAAGGSYETIATIGILAAIAIPQFEEYREKAQLNSILQSTNAVKQNVEEQLRQGVPPHTIVNGNGTILWPEEYADEHISSIDITGGTVTVNLSIEPKYPASDATIIFTPTMDQATGSIHWNCTSKGITTRHLPPMCQDLD